MTPSDSISETKGKNNNMGTVQVEKATVKLVTVIGAAFTLLLALGGGAGLLWQAASFKAEMVGGLQSLNSTCREMSEKLDKNGSAVADVTKRLTQLELLGSAPLRAEIDKLTLRLSELEKTEKDNEQRLMNHQMRTGDSISTRPSSGGKGDNVW